VLDAEDAAARWVALAGGREAMLAHSQAASDDIALAGSRIDALRFFRLFSLPARDFPIVTP
jgi:outer membrane murein-binding lipoprotein Lpp